MACPSKIETEPHGDPRLGSRDTALPIHNSTPPCITLPPTGCGLRTQQEEALAPHPWKTRPGLSSRRLLTTAMTIGACLGFSSRHLRPSFTVRACRRRSFGEAFSRALSSSPDASSSSSSSPTPLPSPFASEYHAPVLWREVLQWLITDPNGTYLDCTLGGGGHSLAILSSLGAEGRLVAFDQDPEALAFATRRLEPYAASGRFRPLRANFRDAASVLTSEGAIPEGGFAGESFRRDQASCRIGS